MNAPQQNPLPPANPVRPRMLWVGGGVLLVLTGIILLPTMMLTGIGIFMIIGGICLVAAGFLSKSGQGVRTEKEASPRHPSGKP